MNNFSGIGRVGGDPVVTQTKDGKAVATFSVVVDSGYGDKKIGTWIKVALFEKRATVAEYISKGDKIGEVGSTGNSSGNHLHFEIQSGRLWKGWTGSRNPQKWIDD